MNNHLKSIVCFIHIENSMYLNEIHQQADYLDSTDTLPWPRRPRLSGPLKCLHLQWPPEQPAPPRRLPSLPALPMPHGLV